MLDVDATDDPLHGRQEGRFFHGYYRSYCYLPLYIFCGQQLLGARLRTADRDAADGTVEELERIVGRIRKRWPGVEIWLRGDSGFCRDELLAWCEAQGVEYVLGIAQNQRLKRSLAPELERAQCGTIRLKLLKIGVRAVRLSFDEGFPEAGLFGQVLARLQSLPLRC